MTKSRTIIDISYEGIVRRCVGDGLDMLSISVARPFYESVHINDRIAFLDMLDTLRKGEGVSPVYLRLMAKDRLRFMEVVLECEECFSEHISLSLLQNRIDEEIEGQLTQTVVTAHEMRTPLNAIIGFADLMLHYDTASVEQIRQYAGMIKQAGEHLLAVVERTMAPVVPTLIHDNEDEQNKPAAQHSEIYPILNEIRSMIEALGAKRSFVFDIEQVKHVTVCADKTTLRQIIINLVSNAIKYTSECGSIVMTAVLTSDGRLKLGVEDDGIGMDEETISRIGRAYVRSSRVKEQGITGNGVGLALVSALLAPLGGELNFEENRPQGTLAEVILPVAGKGKVVLLNGPEKGFAAQPDMALRQLTTG